MPLFVSTPESQSSTSDVTSISTNWFTLAAVTDTGCPPVAEAPNPGAFSEVMVVCCQGASTGAASKEPAVFTLSIKSRSVACFSVEPLGIEERSN